MRTIKAHGLWLTMSLYCCFILIPSFLYAAEVTEQDILDAILGVRSFADEQLKAMDLNGDGKVDVADAVYIKKPIVEFMATGSEIDETVGAHTVAVRLNTTINGPLKYTIGGTAAQGVDYTGLPGTVNPSGNSANIQMDIKSDTIYEGNETIVLSLVPGADYLLGARRSHTVTLKDNPNETNADYLFILSSLTPGVAGSTQDKTGFPGTLFSRTASVNIAFSTSNVVKAHINVKNSIGIADTITQSAKIPANSVSYAQGKLEMVFKYSTQYDSFVTDPSITEFDPVKPSLGDQTKKTLTNTLTLTIHDFDVAKDAFTAKYLEGSFSLHISGTLNDGTAQFFEGILRGSMQP